MSIRHRTGAEASVTQSDGPSTANDPTDATGDEICPTMRCVLASIWTNDSGSRLRNQNEPSAKYPSTGSWIGTCPTMSCVCWSMIATPCRNACGRGGRTSEDARKTHRSQREHDEPGRHQRGPAAGSRFVPRLATGRQRRELLLGHHADRSDRLVEPLEIERPKTRVRDPVHVRGHVRHSLRRQDLPRRRFPAEAGSQVERGAPVAPPTATASPASSPTPIPARELGGPARRLQGDRSTDRLPGR